MYHIPTNNCSVFPSSFEENIIQSKTSEYFCCIRTLSIKSKRHCAFILKLFTALNASGIAKLWVKSVKSIFLTSWSPTLEHNLLMPRFKLDCTAHSYVLVDSVLVTYVFYHGTKSPFFNLMGLRFLKRRIY